MDLVWKISAKEVKKVRAFMEEHSEDALVSRRLDRNGTTMGPRVSKARFWKAVLYCMLTSQQKSGPDSPVNKFIRHRPFPLRYSVCCRQKDVGKFCKRTFGAWGGIRFTDNISKWLAENILVLETGMWIPIREALNELRCRPGMAVEREAARLISSLFKGVGPKQSRNILQSVGLTQFETPLDSRVIKWLNNFGFPIHLSSECLSDHDYYEFVSDGFQALCEKAEVLPCVLDAAIFASFDKGGWAEEQLVG